MALQPGSFTLFEPFLKEAKKTAFEDGLYRAQTGQPNTRPASK
jgi:hypothetical protein